MQDIMLSVCVVSYNHEKYIEECWNHILGQKFDFSKNQSNYKTLKPKKSFKPKKTKEEKEKEKEREKEEAKMIKEMNHEQIEDLITRMDKQLNEM